MEFVGELRIGASEASRRRNTRSIVDGLKLSDWDDRHVVGVAAMRRRALGDRTDRRERELAVLLRPPLGNHDALSGRADAGVGATKHGFGGESIEVALTLVPEERRIGVLWV